MQNSGTEFEKIAENSNNQHNLETVSDIGDRSLAIPEEPAFIDGIQRRLKVYNDIYEMVQAAYSSFGSGLLTERPSQLVAAVSVANEISNSIIEYLQGPELIRDIEGAKNALECVYH